NRLAVFAGLDDMVVEAVRMGAEGWIAGLVNALPRETMALFRAARDGDDETADAIYRWFLPLLRMDTVPKFVQLIKLVQQEVGMGHERVRGPRMVLQGAEREEALKVIRAALQSRPAL
ncbi:MAG TPA: dihydrodipicolinate synthase family protein, partial [Casimicrobiaceae bacterium]|nr:dihydrodipicolinate synthase family protein [Casimicrobiaceae bacterium]